MADIADRSAVELAADARDPHDVRLERINYSASKRVGEVQFVVGAAARSGAVTRRWTPGSEGEPFALLTLT